MEVLGFLAVSDGDGYGYGYGYGKGYGDGYGDGKGYGDGNGYGNGNGDGYGYGKGNGDGNGIAEINGMKVYNVDGVPTCIVAIKGNFAKGYSIRHNIELVPCFIAKVGNSFAHGETLKKAFADAQSKEFQRLPIEERIDLFVKEHPDNSELISNEKLFSIHNMLTWSCEFGRREFCKQHNISLDNSMTIAEFLGITKDAYGGEIIRNIIDKYSKIN